MFNHPPLLPDGDQLTKAHEAAEALFRPGREVVQPPTPVNSARKPRVLPANPVHREIADAKTSEKITAAPEKNRVPQISNSQISLIKTWMKFGMTIGQVANVFGVTVSEIEHLLRRG